MVPDSCKQSKPSTMPTHDLHHKRTRMGEGCRVDVINGFTDPVEGSGCADSEIGHGHIIVYGAYEANYLEVTMSFCLLRRNHP